MTIVKEMLPALMGTINVGETWLLVLLLYQLSRHGQRTGLIVSSLPRSLHASLWPEVFRETQMTDRGV